MIKFPCKPRTHSTRFINFWLIYYMFAYKFDTIHTRILWFNFISYLNLYYIIIILFSTITVQYLYWYAQEYSCIIIIMYLYKIVVAQLWNFGYYYYLKFQTAFVKMGKSFSNIFIDKIKLTTTAQKKGTSYQELPKKLNN